MKIKIAVIILLLIASILLLSSCGSFLIYKGSSPEFNVEKTFSGDTEYIIKSGLPKETVDYFSFIETSSVFNLDYDDIIDIYGKPEKESDVSGGYMALKELQYEC
ncbi:MAG: hypothetical protein GX633_00725, partial [Clostridiales bacterium]|nr:hypothetical protein [Clostridiales bacterium]